MVDVEAWKFVALVFSLLMVFGGEDPSKRLLRPRIWERFYSPNSGYTEGVLTVRVKAGFD